jgi:hypothetical protein
VDTQVVPATPTDDALANSDRTVSVLPNLDHVSKLKREALLFDQIGIPRRLNPDGNRDELDRLRDIGIVLDIPRLGFSLKDPTTLRQFLAAFRCFQLS